MIKQSFCSKFSVPIEKLFSWHETEGAFSRLNPPWEPVQLISINSADEKNSIKDGTIVKLKIPLFGIFSLLLPSFLKNIFSLSWSLVHKNYKKNDQFEDHQLAGPFNNWKHRHIFTPIDPGQSELIDQIEYSLPLGFITEKLLGSFFKSKLDSLFSYRHRITKNDLHTIKKYENSFLKEQKIVVSGASGLIGKSLVVFLRLAGHKVYTLVRKKSSDPFSIYWDPQKLLLDLSLIESTDYFIHLSGENVGKKWSKKIKEQILSSRVHTTDFLVESIKKLTNKPKCFISASGSSNSGFLGEVIKQWERASLPLKELGIRVCHTRFSVVLSPEGGALKKLLPPFLLGLGGPVGTGKNFMSCIAKDDVIYGIYHLMANSNMEGPFNFSMPVTLTNKEFSLTLSKVLRRPCFFTVPAFVIRSVLGQMAGETILSSTNIYPDKLIASGFEFYFPNPETALSFYLGKS